MTLDTNSTTVCFIHSHNKLENSIREQQTRPIEQTVLCAVQVSRDHRFSVTVDKSNTKFLSLGRKISQR